MLALETIRLRIRERLTATGLSANEASRRAGLGLSYVNDLLSGKSKNPVTTRLAQLASVLDCDLGYLQGTQESPRVVGEVVSFPGNGHGAKVEGASVMPRTVPFYSVNLSDPEGFFSMIDAKAARFSPAASVDIDTDAYAVSVADELNVPRYMPGEVVLVSTRKPVASGTFAVIRLSDDRAMIRRVVAITPTEIEVEAIGDGTKGSVARSEIKSIHRIVASFEG